MVKQKSGSIVNISTTLVSAGSDRGAQTFINNCELESAAKTIERDAIRFIMQVQTQEIRLTQPVFS
jgi:hypothetical protein